MVVFVSVPIHAKNFAERDSTHYPEPNHLETLGIKGLVAVEDCPVPLVVDDALLNRQNDFKPGVIEIPHFRLEPGADSATLRDLGIGRVLLNIPDDHFRFLELVIGSQWWPGTMWHRVLKHAPCHFVSHIQLLRYFLLEL